MASAGDCFEEGSDGSGERAATTGATSDAKKIARKIVARNRKTAKGRERREARKLAIEKSK